MTKYKNPYLKHIPVTENVGASLRQMKRDLKLHSLNEVIEKIIKTLGAK